MFRVRFWCCAVILAAACFCPASTAHAQQSLPILASSSRTNPVERALSSRVSISWGELSLDELVATLRERFRINVVVDHRALDGIEFDKTATLKSIEVTGVELEEALTMVLEQVELCLMVRDTMLVVTTPEEADNHLETRVYPVSDLLYSQPITVASLLDADYDSLIEITTSSVASDSWDEVGGAGSIEPCPYSQSLVISQTRRVHRKVQALLDTLRKAKAIQPAPRLSAPANVGDQPYRPGTAPAGGIWSRPARLQGGLG